MVEENEIIKFGYYFKRKKVFPTNLKIKFLRYQISDSGLSLDKIKMKKKAFNVFCIII